ncbi:MAG: hypothetical protein AAF567_15345 [Actinomycetota bacterium]
MTAAPPEHALDESTAHPRIQERRDAVEDAETRRRNRWLIALGAVVAVLALAALSTRTALLDVDEVRILGASSAPGDTWRGIAGVEVGAPLVGLDLQAAEQRLLGVNQVAAVSSKRTWSGVVTFTIVERRPVARVATPEGTLIVADDGLVLDVTDEPDPGLTVIGGAMFSAEAGTHVPVELDDSIVVADVLPSDIDRIVDRIIVGQDRLALDLVGGGVIELGDSRDLDAKFDAVRALIGQVSLSCLERIDVRAATVPILARADSCR